jgi:hypothetical protein
LGQQGLRGRARGNRMRLLAMVVLAAMMLASEASAELRLIVSDAPGHRLILAQAPDSVQAELTALGPNDAPMFDAVDCATLGTKLIQTARRDELRMDVIIARYNLMNVWTGNLCGGVTDAMPTPMEARAWLEELAELSREEDDAPFVDARRRLAEVLVFGAPGVAPDYRAARVYTAAEAARDPQLLLYLAYMAEHGLGAEADQTQALEYLRQAEARGNGSAAALLAQSLEPGDEVAAFARYRDLAQNAISPPVWFRLGLMYLEGRGLTRDPCQARQWLQAAAGHAWTPVPQARPYLETIRAESLCTAR